MEEEPDSLIEIDQFTVENTSPADGRALRLRQVSLSIAPGEICVLGGEAGSGKSLLCEYLCGITRRRMKVMGGSVRVAGVDVSTKRSTRRSPLVSFIGREPEAAFNPHHTVERSLLEFTRLMGRDSRSRKNLDWNEAFYAVGIVEPERLLTRLIVDLPQAMLQRLALMRALLAGSKVIVCDEATSNLDRIAESQFIDLVRQIREERGVTLVLAMGSLRNADRYADRIAMFFEGGILETGTALDLMSHPATRYTAEFLATSPKLSHSPHELPTISREAILEAEEIVHGNQFSPAPSVGEEG